MKLSRGFENGFKKGLEKSAYNINNPLHNFLAGYALFGLPSAAMSYIDHPERENDDRIKRAIRHGLAMGAPPALLGWFAKDLLGAMNLRIKPELGKE